MSRSVGKCRLALVALVAASGGCFAIDWGYGVGPGESGSEAARSCGDEACDDGLDGDCDGQVDEGCPCEPGQKQPCYSGDPATAEIGACRRGEQECGAEGTFGACAGEVTPADEACNGADDDCDGSEDDGLGDLTCGDGACQAQVPACKDGVAGECVPLGASGPETCDGLDDDCDGNVDEGCACSDGDTQPCYTGPPATQGTGECKDGTQTCTGGAWGACASDVGPSSESCDGKDNDCDGVVDDDLGTTSCGVGECHVTAPACGPACTPAAPQPESCDGKDNDCDGQVDEGNPDGGNACITGQPGACSVGIYVCNGGALECAPTAPPGTETCNGEDDDCDGDIDEGNPGGGAACSTGQPGVCGPGIKTCIGGAIACDPNTQASPESCGDGLDNDCDGQVDDSCCMNVALAATPTTSGGGLEPFYGPVRLNNGVGQSCGEWSWVDNTSTTVGAYFQYSWSSPQTIGSFYVDGEHPTAPACGQAPRDIKSAKVQYWNGSSWINAGTLSNQADYLFTFPSPITTTALRLYNVVTSVGGGDSMIFEWYVYTGTGCGPS